MGGLRHRRVAKAGGHSYSPTLQSPRPSSTLQWPPPALVELSPLPGRERGRGEGPPTLIWAAEPAFSFRLTALKPRRTTTPSAPDTAPGSAGTPRRRRGGPPASGAPAGAASTSRGKRPPGRDRRPRPPRPADRGAIARGMDHQHGRHSPTWRYTRPTTSVRWPSCCAPPVPRRRTPTTSTAFAAG